MPHDEKKLGVLLQWYRQEVGSDLVLAIIAKNDSSVVNSIVGKTYTEVKTKLIESVRSIIQLIIQRIDDDFRLGSFGAGMFDTADYRFIFCRAGDETVFITLLNPLAMVDSVFPYSFLAAEKVARIFDGRPISPVIPKLEALGKDINRKVGTFQKFKIHSKEYAYKLILVGDGAVGKTSMVHRFVEGKFRANYQSTIGTAILKKECKFEGLNSKVRFIIWDLAGQAQFLRVRQHYMVNAEAGLVVYDITRRESFNNVRKWLDEIKKGSPKHMYLILIGNKADLNDEREVSLEEGMKLAEDLGMPFIETSAKTGERINETFRMLAFQLVLGFVEVGESYACEDIIEKRDLQKTSKNAQLDLIKGKLNEKEREALDFWNGLIKVIKETSLHMPLMKEGLVYTYTLHDDFVSVELNFIHVNKAINHSRFSALEEKKSKIQDEFSNTSWQLKNQMEWNADLDKNHFHIQYKFKDVGLNHPYSWDSLHISIVDAMRSLIKVLQKYMDNLDS